MPYSKGSSSASTQAMFSKSSPKGIGGSLVHSDCDCVSLVGLGSLATSLTAASTSTTEVSWSSLSGTFGFSFLSGSGLADAMLSVLVSPLVTRLLSSVGGSFIGNKWYSFLLLISVFCIW